MTNLTSVSSIRKKNLKAFTLLEVVTVMAIVGVLTTLISISFGTQRTKKDLETNAREFASVLKEAQNYALTGKQTGAGVTCEFRVTWTLTTYSLRSVSKNIATDACDVVNAPMASYLLKQGVTFASSNPAGVGFALPWAVSVSSGAVAQFTKSGVVHTACLNSSGVITDLAGGGPCP